MTGKQSINANGREIKVNFDALNNFVSFFNQNAEILKDGSSSITNMIEDLRAQFTVDTFVNIDESLGGLKINIDSIYEQLITLNGKIEEVRSYYEDLCNRYGSKEISKSTPGSSDASFEKEVEKSYGESKDGHSITNTGRELNIDGKTYYSYFGSDSGDGWISQAAANDPELRNLLSKYGYAWEEAKSHSDGWASLGDSRGTYISNLQNAETNLQNYLSEHGYNLTTSTGSSSASNNVSGGNMNYSGSSSASGTWNDAVANSYKPGTDGYTISHSGRELNINNDTYYNYFGDSWLTDAAANDQDLRAYLNNYNVAWEGAKSYGDGFASLGSSRGTAIGKLQTAESELQNYLSEHGYPSLTTKNN